MSAIDTMDAIKHSLRNMQTKGPETYTNNSYWSPMTSEYLSDMEKRFQRGRSEERYPHYYRGHSASPVRTVRSRSTERESFSYYEPTSSSTEVVTYSRATSPVVARTYSDSYDYSPYYYSSYKPYSYNYRSSYLPSSYYNPYCSYYRPYNRYYSFYDSLPYRHLPSSTLRHLLDLDLPYRYYRYL